MDWAGAGTITALLGITYVVGYVCVGLMIAQGTVSLTRRQFTRVRDEPLFRPALLSAMQSRTFWLAYWTWWGAAIANTLLPLLYGFTMPVGPALVLFVGGALFNIPLALLRVWMWRFWAGASLELA